MKKNFVFVSGHVDAIRPDCTDRRFLVVEKPEAKLRRPEVARKAAQLQQANPKLSDEKALTLAKAMITAKGGTDHA